MQKNYGFDTLAVHAGFKRDNSTMSKAVPIYQTTAYEFDSVEDAAQTMALKKSGNIYSRLGNPTTEVLEERITALEKGVATVCFASGMAAVIAAIQNLAECNSEVIALSTIYGGTYTLLFSRFYYRYGIKAVQVDPEDFAALENAITDKTRCIYLETLGNPNINIPEFKTITDIAHKHGLPVILDNTFGTPALFDAKVHGADFVVHSLTKYIGGHGNSMGGSVTDLGTFSFQNNPRFREFNEPDPSYHGLVYSSLGDMGYIVKLRACFLRDTGACLSPFNSFLLLLGLETLSLRMKKHSDNALTLAQYLSSHPKVAWVSYPGLKGDKYYDRAKKYLPKGSGGILSFGVKGGVENASRFIDGLELVPLVVNVCDARTMVVNPAGTTHSQLDEEGLKAAGVSPDMIRVSVGLEDIDDIIADFAQSLERV